MSTANSRLVEKLLTCFDQSQFLKMAEQPGFTVRQRNIHPLDFILSLIAALGGDGNSDTQDDLHHKFNELTGPEAGFKQ